MVRPRVVLVADNIIVDLADRRRGVLPRLVAEMGVGRHRIHLDAHLLKRRVDVGEIFEFGRTDEREIGGVEEENRSEEHTSELQSLMRISNAVFCWKKKTLQHTMTARRSGDDAQIREINKRLPAT